MEKLSEICAKNIFARNFYSLEVFFHLYFIDYKLLASLSHGIRMRIRIYETEFLSVLRNFKVVEYITIGNVPSENVRFDGSINWRILEY